MSGDFPVEGKIFQWPQSTQSECVKQVTLEYGIPFEFQLPPGEYVLIFKYPNEKSCLLAAIAPDIVNSRQIMPVKSDDSNELHEFQFTVPAGPPSPQKITIALAKDDQPISISGRIWDSLVDIEKALPASPPIKGLKGTLSPTVRLIPGNYIFWFRSKYPQALDSEFSLIVTCGDHKIKEEKFKVKDTAKLSQFAFSIPILAN